MAAGFGGGALCDDFAFDGAAVVISPDGAGAVDPYLGCRMRRRGWRRVPERPTAGPLADR